MQQRSSAPLLHIAQQHETHSSRSISEGFKIWKPLFWTSTYGVCFINYVSKHQYIPSIPSLIIPSLSLPISSSVSSGTVVGPLSLSFLRLALLPPPLLPLLSSPLSFSFSLSFPLMFRSPAVWRTTTRTPPV